MGMRALPSPSTTLHQTGSLPVYGSVWKDMMSGCHLQQTIMAAPQDPPLIVASMKAFIHLFKEGLTAAKTKRSSGYKPHFQERRKMKL